MMDIVFKIIGAAGLILIISGLRTKQRKRQDIHYIAGGICLALYSIYLKDIIFIVLQVVYTCVAIYDFSKLEHSAKVR